MLSAAQATETSARSSFLAPTHSLELGHDSPKPGRLAEAGARRAEAGARRARAGARLVGFNFGRHGGVTREPREVSLASARGSRTSTPKAGTGAGEIVTINPKRNLRRRRAIGSSAHAGRAYSNRTSGLGRAILRQIDHESGAADQ
jgi:hypothetical protein